MPQNARAERLNPILLYGFAALLAWSVFLIFRPFLVPLGWAAVLAVLFYPWNRRLMAHWGATRAAAVGTAGVTLILIVPVLLLMVLFVREGIQAAQELQHAIAAGRMGWVNRAWSWLAMCVGETGSDLPTLLHQSAGRVGTALASQLGAVLRNIVIFLFELFVMLFALFYFIRDGDAILRMVRRTLPFEETAREQMLLVARDLIQASVTVSFVIAGLQGSLGGLGFALVGIGQPVFWGIVMAFLSLLPVVGSWPVWVPAVVWLFATGHSGRAIVLLAICAGLVGTIDNFLRPALLSGRARMNGLLVFISVLGGIAAFGMLGIVLGPIVVATAMGILEVHVRRELPA
jgi:predicted PurR-regulated permease PerM